MCHAKKKCVDKKSIDGKKRCTVRYLLEMYDLVVKNREYIKNTLYTSHRKLCRLACFSKFDPDFNKRS